MRWYCLFRQQMNFCFINCRLIPEISAFWWFVYSLQQREALENFGPSYVGSSRNRSVADELIATHMCVCAGTTVHTDDCYKRIFPVHIAYVMRYVCCFFTGYYEHRR